jgi:hypothetical protein
MEMPMRRTFAPTERERFCALAFLGHFLAQASQPICGHLINAKKRVFSSSGRTEKRLPRDEERLSRGFSLVVIAGLSALSWSVLIPIVRAIGAAF